MDEKNVSLSFAATDKVYVYDIPTFTEKETTSKKWVTWGENDEMASYLSKLVDDVSTLKTIVYGTADYVAGDDAICNITGFEKEINRKGDTMFELINWLSRDWLTYGGFCFQVIRNKNKEVGEIYYIDFQNIRTNKDKDIFWYSEEFGKKYARSNKTVVYPKFIPEAKDTPASIVYVTNEKSHTYPIPRYSGALKAAEIERQIDTFHLSSLENGFNPSYIINFLNGIPTDDVKAEIEKNFEEKYIGTTNTGRIILNFADSKDNATKVERLDSTDFGSKYQECAKRSREQLFCAFQAIPALFGLMTESKGFAQEEFDTAFRLYNRTVVKPIQRLLSKTFDRTFGVDNSITIQPYSIEETTNNEEKTVE